MTPEALAALHAAVFTDAPPPWSPAAFDALLHHPGTVLALRPGGFALGRVAGPEVEILTVAVLPEARRRGLGAALVAEIEAAAAARGAEESFLEVAETNAPARALYARLGYRAVGRRPRYYLRRDRPAVDALVLRKALAATENH